MHIQIVDPATKVKKSRSGERQWNTQTGIIHVGLERREITINLEDGASAYASGDYEMDLDKSIGFDQYGSPSFKFALMLKPLKSAPSALPR